MVARGQGSPAALQELHPRLAHESKLKRPIRSAKERLVVLIVYLAAGGGCNAIRQPERAARYLGGPSSLPKRGAGFSKDGFRANAIRGMFAPDS